MKNYTFRNILLTSRSLWKYFNIKIFEISVDNYKTFYSYYSLFYFMKNYSKIIGPLFRAFSHTNSPLMVNIVALFCLYCFHTSEINYSEIYHRIKFCDSIAKLFEAKNMSLCCWMKMLAFIDEVYVIFCILAPSDKKSALVLSERETRHPLKFVTFIIPIFL